MQACVAINMRYMLNFVITNMSYNNFIGAGSHLNKFKFEFF